FALSWFWSARTRFAEPVCSVLMRLVVKSERVGIVAAFVPNVSDWVRTLVNALLRASTVFVIVVSDWKPAPLIWDSPRPAELKVTAAIVSELVLFSLNTTFKLLPFNKLTPL